MNQRGVLRPLLSIAATGLLAALLGALPAVAGAPYAADFGDAPDGQNAGYGPPFAGVVGNFPTLYATPNSRFGQPGGHAITTSLERLGTIVSSEFGPDDAADPDVVQNFINDDFDDGLVGGACPVGTPPVPWPSPLSVTLTFRVSVAVGAPNVTRYINILIDRNHDGVWSGPGEWAVVDRAVLVAPGTSALVAVGPVPYSLAVSGSWMRVSLTRSTVVGTFPNDGSGWDGAGAHGFGEFEDYLLSSATTGLDHAAAAAAASAQAAAMKFAIDADYDQASDFDADMAFVDVDAEVDAAVAAADSASASASAAASASASASSSASAAAAACASALASASASAAACVSCPCATVCGSAQAYALAAAEACAQAQVTAQSSASASAFASAAAAAASAAASSAAASASASAAAFSAAYASASSAAAAIASAQASANSAASAASSSAASALAAACGGNVAAAADAAASAGASAVAAASAFAIAVAQADANARAYADAEAEVEVLVHVRTTAEARAVAASSSQASAMGAATAASTSASSATGIATSMTSATASIVATCSGDCCPGACGLCWSMRIVRVGVFGATINWSDCPGNISYDLLAGTMNGGPTYCLAENTPTSQGSDPGITVAPGQALFYLHRTFTGLADDTLDDGTNTIPRTLSSCSTGCDAAICNDSNVCTTDGCDNGTHQCTHALTNCDDGNPCTRDTCHPTSGCQHTPITGSCNDGSACTTGDTCSPGGVCGGAPVSCNDGNPCTTNSCNPATGCVYSPQTGPACNDQSVCTTGDHCTSGVCGGTPQSCDDGNDCTTDACNPQNGCHHSPHTGSCSDGNPCSTGDTCVDGTCNAGPPDDCDDGNPCTNDGCNFGSGCQHVPVNGTQCDDGNDCTIGDSCSGGNCQSGPPIVCDDGNPCTADLCTPEGCLHGDDNAADCSDGNPCSAGDHCQGGLCASTGPETCDDGTTCTDDFCDFVNGCQHLINDANPCDDANACTTGDHCQAGVCVSNPVPPSTITVSNPSPIGIPTSGPGAPYPSSISVPPRGAVISMTVRLFQLTHPFPDDLDLLLVSPTGQTAILMSDVGGNAPVSNLTLFLSDSLPNSMPDNGPLAPGPGNYRPTNVGAGDTWPPPAPPPTGGAQLSIFNGTNPTGNWTLWVLDDQGGNGGQFQGGWNMSLQTHCGPSFAAGEVDTGPPRAKVKQPAATEAGASSSSHTQPPAAASAGTGR